MRNFLIYILHRKISGRFSYFVETCVSQGFNKGNGKKLQEKKNHFRHRLNDDMGKSLKHFDVY